LRLSHILLRNYRNYRLLDLPLGLHSVIVGENKIGKSNLLFALRLILDPSLPDSARQLREEDFWDGLPRPLSRSDRIEVAVDLADFEENDDHLALLGEHLIETDPLVARLTYVFQPLPTLEGEPSKDADYEFFIFGGTRPENRVSYELRRCLPMDLLPALRDAEGDLANWRRSPLRPLLDRAAGQIDRDRLHDLSEGVSQATSAIAECEEVQAVSGTICDKLVEMVGSLHALEMALGFSPADGERLIRSLRLFIDGGKRSVSDASLGSANLLYLALKSLEIEQQVAEGGRSHTFLAIEEPEAHLHPHVQRRVFRTFLRPRQAQPESSENSSADRMGPTTILLTTHSPHLVSVSPIHSFVILRKSADGASTEGASTANIDLTTHEIADIERYLDVTRGEILFAKAVLLVEGEAEEYLLPVLATLNGYDLDGLGISVCSVAGIHFLPYLKFISPSGLNIPYAVITDTDPMPTGEFLGLSRVRTLLEYLNPDALETTQNDDDVIELAKQQGIFLTDHTLEVALFRSGRHKTFCQTMQELTTNAAARERAGNWRADPSTLDPRKMLSDIKAIGKGRFAQRWADRISHSNCDLAPQSIKEALQHVVSHAR
jgi:putative ATP-dependent endonuclease of OLD family